jgi:hypothetical protein
MSPRPTKKHSKRSWQWRQNRKQRARVAARRKREEQRRQAAALLPVIRKAVKRIPPPCGATRARVGAPLSRRDECVLKANHKEPHMGADGRQWPRWAPEIDAGAMPM